MRWIIYYSLDRVRTKSQVSFLCNPSKIPLIIPIEDFALNSDSVRERSSAFNVINERKGWRLSINLSCFQLFPVFRDTLFAWWLVKLFRQIMANSYRYNNIFCTYHVLVWVVFVVEDGNYLTELRQNIVVSGHVGCQYASDDALTYFPVDRKMINVSDEITRKSRARLRASNSK